MPGMQAVAVPVLQPAHALCPCALHQDAGDLRTADDLQVGALHGAPQIGPLGAHALAVARVHAKVASTRVVTTIEVACPCNAALRSGCNKRIGQRIMGHLRNP